MANAVFCLATDVIHARALVARLRHDGFGDHDVSLLMLDGVAPRDLGRIGPSAAPTVLAGIGALAVPGIGPLVAAGPILAGLAGRASSGLAPALVHFGLREADARIYEQRLRAGHLLVAVDAPAAADIGRATTAFQEGGGLHLALGDSPPLAAADRPPAPPGSPPQ